nr:tRNA (adenosine(37)-N6)-dimethylallyltransferase MiaA [Devosia oryzisoli]
MIAGPTASGKSALALERARRTQGVIFNADAMQVYDTLALLTARPGADDLTAAEHRLYGFVPASLRFSTGAWLRAVERELAAVAPDQEVIFVGGTGLYFDALTQGFAEVPPIAPEIVEAVSHEIAGLDQAGRMALLQREDAATAERIGVADPQRVIRALAVKRATGRPLSGFQDEPVPPPLLEGWHVERMVLMPERHVLRERIARRFATMMEQGAVVEVEALRALGLDPGLPAMKAIGVPEISAWLDGQLSREEAVDRAVIATQQYAKRQRTWFRNRFGDWPVRSA